MTRLNALQVSWEMTGPRTTTTWSFDEQGAVLARRRLPEGIVGVAGLHALVAAHLPEEWADLPPGEAQALVMVGSETDRGSWVAALVAAGYEVLPQNRAQASA